MMMFPLAITQIENDSDREFMERLYIDYSTIMRSVADKILFNPMDVEDVISDSCASLIHHLEDVRNMESCVLKRYIVITVRNHSLDRVRKLGRRHEDTMDEFQEFVGQIPAPETSTEERVIKSIAIEAGTEALKGLPQRQLDLLNMKYLLEYDDRQIADVMGIKAGSVRQYLTRARRQALDLLISAGLEGDI